MSLFQSMIVNHHLKSLNQDELNRSWEKFQKHFQNSEIQANIRASKEEEYQGEFLIDLFVSIFGYIKKPQPNFNIVTEKKNIKDAKKADGAIIKDDRVIAVIELKGMDTTDLSSIETQAFGYKNNQPACRYVITSNFQKLRFYIDNAVEFLEFDLFKISQEDFALLYLLLKADNLLSDLPLKIKSESLSQEEIVTKQLYKDYSTFKRALFDDLVKNNTQYDPLTLFHKSQKLLDRLLFIFFAEDSGLLQANTAKTMLKEWDQAKLLKIPMSLYDKLKSYFNFLNTGYKDETSEIFAYNGGLFKPDDVLDNVKIADDLLYNHIGKLSDYDFKSEVDVNILGHIFENSLTEIDEIKAQLNGEVLDKSQSKRKKDGVFYTPKYITNYIIENTVGKLCRDKKAELDISDEHYVFFKFANPNTKRFAEQAEKYANYQLRLKRLDEYRNWLLGITVCDCACGSGAFLNETLNFLIAEHRYIDELSSKIGGGSLVFQEVRNHILEHNLFGVDINQEAVEIAKLSLWLRTAEPHRKLSNLNENLKCGNSLIDDPNMAGEKAFIWENEFPDVFKKGGFDVVIGNPPYVKLEQIKAVSEKLAKMSFETFEKRGDLYVLFVEKGFNILKENGLISFIMPNKWLQAGYGKTLRKYFLERNLEQLIDFGDLQIFEGATTYPCIFIAQKAKPTENIKISVLNSVLSEDFNSNVKINEQIFEKSNFDENTWVISSNQNINLLNRLKEKYLTLNEFVKGQYFCGIKTGLQDAFFTNLNIQDNEHLIPLVQGRNIAKYSSPKAETQLILFKKGFSEKVGIKSESEGEKYLEKNFPDIFSWLIPYKEKAVKRGDKGYFWWELRSCDYYDVFAKPKIMFQTIQVKPCFAYDETGLFCNDTIFMIPTDNKGLLAVLNSKLAWWLISQFCSKINGGFKLNWQYFGQIPVPLNLETLSPKADEMLFLNKELQEINGKLLRTLKRKFDLTDPSKKLQNWQNLNYKEFVKELDKKKIKLSLSDEANWEDYFLSEQTKAQALQAKISQIDKEIDSMVYQLYGLTDDEIKIIELAI